MAAAVAAAVRDAVVPSSLKLAQLKRVAFLCGLTTSGTKKDIAERISDAAESAAPVRQASRTTGDCPRILSVDLGLRNLAYSLLTPAGVTNSVSRPGITASQRASAPPQVHLHAWRRHDLVSASPSARKNDDAFSPAALSATAVRFVWQTLLPLDPTYVLFERQRFRTHGAAPVQEWTLRVNMLEAMMHAVFRTLKECGHWGGEVVSVPPSRVGPFWLGSEGGNAEVVAREPAVAEPTLSVDDDLDACTPKEKAVGSSRSRRQKANLNMKKEKMDIMGNWLEERDIILPHGKSVETMIEIYFQHWKRKPGSRKPSVKESNEVGEDGVIKKVDDLADSLLQGMAWIKWEENKSVLRSKGGKLEELGATLPLPVDKIAAEAQWASVVGLLAAGSKVTSLLFTVMTKASEAPSLAQSLFWEVADISAALARVQEYVLGRQEIQRKRGSLILLEHVLTSLTGCVSTFSDLQANLDGLDIDPDMGVFDRIKWMRQESSLKEIVQRLQHHKSSLILILTILQCDSMHEAESSNQRLCGLVEEMLHSHRDLASRIHRLEDERSGSTRAPSTIGWRDSDSMRSRRVGSSKIMSYIDSGMHALRLTFERDLEDSRIYNRARLADRQSLTSTTSTALYSTAMSVFSKLSLSEISVISFYALPVYASDLQNSECYVFGDSAIFEAPKGRDLNQHALTSTAGNPSKDGASKRSKLLIYGVARDDFEAIRTDELDLKSGESIVVVAQSDPDWIVAKPVGRIGRPGLVPLRSVSI
ncbi:hypothetical protein DL771_005954 [Monosporascus sp. 5C6A]|nr:hypothetical protein DL771_005954 [Monosporascus sp. 5C6A]